MMKSQRYRLTFTTPAFLGNADQHAQWRTPPIKALLRQWWRVAYAAEQKFDVDVTAMRRAEDLLFGHAWLENDAVERNGRTEKVAARKSEVRLRLSHWKDGSLGKRQWPEFATVNHPEVKSSVGSDLYMGFGPLVYDKASRRSGLKANAAIQAGESADLSLAYPDESAPQIERALCLINLFATVGGRSRNGWGSLHLESLEGTSPSQTSVPLRDWQQALALDWPHAIGQDGQGALTWQTRPFDDWKALMQKLAIIKIGLRTQFRFTTRRDEPRPEDRHWLSYPITNHSVRAWDGKARLPNSLRFKVRPAPDNSRQYVGVIFHMPCLPPLALNPEENTITRVWERVHQFLDTPTQQLTRISA